MNVAIILAGGSGTRMGSIDTPKQFIDIYGKPLIVHTIESFDINSNIDYILIACKEEWIEDLTIWTRKYELNKVKWIISGGNTRQESVFNGIKKLKNACNEDDIVVIHDAARPLISQRIINENIKCAQKYGAVDTVIPTADTIIKSLDNTTISIVPVRKELYLGQTPQSFKYSIIDKAHDKGSLNNKSDATDDCQLVLKQGTKVHLVQGDKLNFKITTFEDLTILKSIIKMGKLEVI
ncbi:2-C-methyl-D-erythritol 4-phosphate cytidylyltransferase [Clostridium sporogenes]|uniref:2-C-methyl-D-erythritol 4-phosphate cytidylyltransferase n=1 Tax=Clostridium botulinum TaxID=1491 RepID=UPI000717AE7E|nr:2-C-methyl-D-erythritol 4-phosphate cytidylyltransferase [Clostridium botulinum]KRU25378.1 2-C-methyl-D-erythritol 4-phosphate cytidylyltransferase [Clostridium sporogenes]KRU28616.1 2-C-methyl-D-erythritol 4-phosphate cytidylyltransferase [Clostridium sporogenes]KRU32747.1 2-C-methyl-D-erythritol 4-phosphate cytidylyltransferase [Clostridium sporogenes]KRU47520.1 2-C-methyl-D-erythritol 4-phosphate cytidylyltransferase [Clostridium sporogenes]MBZ1327880.1 2-C-methyl-D-erythritol 4-phosphat